MKDSRITAFTKAKAELAEVTNLINDIELKSLKITPNLEINTRSSDSQYVYGLGVLDSQIQATKDLGLPIEELEEKLKLTKSMFKDRQDLDFYVQYKSLQDTLVDRLRDCLTNEDLAELAQQRVDEHKSTRNEMAH